MNALLSTIGEVLGIIDKAVPDQAQKDQLIAKVNALAEETYRKELETKTVPWVDALHKLGRQLLSWGALFSGIYILSKHPTVDALALATIIAPGGIYNYIKGRGK